MFRAHIVIDDGDGPSFQMLRHAREVCGSNNKLLSEAMPGMAYGMRNEQSARSLSATWIRTTGPLEA